MELADIEPLSGEVSLKDEGGCREIRLELFVSSQVMQGLTKAPADSVTE
jgi:hypothetical protein